LDANLAGKINEVAHLMIDCEDGRKFDTAHGSRKRAGTATYGQALCAAEGVIGMSQKGGALADLTLLDHSKMGMEFAATAGKAKEALLVLKDFIIAYGPVLAIPEEHAEQLGIYVLAIVVHAILEKIPIGPENYIRPEIAVSYGAMSPRPTPTTTAPSSSSSGCPDPTKTPVSSRFQSLRQSSNHNAFKLLCGREQKNDCKMEFRDSKNAATESADTLCSDVSFQKPHRREDSANSSCPTLEDSVEGM
jgi:hypothetical protein